MKQTVKQTLFVYVLIALGTGMMSIAIAGIYDAAGLVTGGFTGIAIMLKNVTQNLIPGGIPLGLTNAVLNVPVFLFSYWKLGKRFAGRSLFGTVMLSIWLSVVPPLHLIEEDYLLVALFGGVAAGIGYGLVIRTGATSGGTDMVAALIQTRLRHYSVVQIMQVIDAFIVIAGLYVFGLRPALYAIVAIFVTTKVSDAFLEGFKHSKAAFVITAEYERVADLIIKELHRGVTALTGVGMYTKEERKVLYCVVSRKEIVRVKEIVHAVDPTAFVIVSDVREVLGEGFLEHQD